MIEVLPLDRVKTTRQPAPGDDLAPLVASLAQHGQINPILVTADMYVIDGMRRVRAAEQYGVDTIVAMVCDDFNAALIQLAQNMDTDDEVTKGTFGPFNWPRSYDQYQRLAVLGQAMRSVMQSRAYRGTKRGTGLIADSQFRTRLLSALDITSTKYQSYAKLMLLYNAAVSSGQVPLIQAAQEYLDDVNIRGVSPVTLRTKLERSGVTRNWDIWTSSPGGYAVQGAEEQDRLLRTAVSQLDGVLLGFRDFEGFSQSMPVEQRIKHQGQMKKIKSTLNLILRKMEATKHD